MINIDTIMANFEVALDEWMESKQHKYNCMAWSEGQSCCLDEEDDSDFYNSHGRKFVMDYFRAEIEKILEANKDSSNG